MPPRDTMEFAAALLLGAAIGAGLTRVVLSGREEPGSRDGDAGLLGTFIGAAGDEAARVLREAAGRAPGWSRDHGGSS